MAKTRRKSVPPPTGTPTPKTPAGTQDDGRPDLPVAHRVQISREEFQGPIPPPTLLEQYDRIHPGLANRIVVMAERQSEHRQAIEMIAVRAQSRNETLGVFSALLIGVTAIIGGVVVAISGHPVTGWATVVTAIAALVGVFVYGRRLQEADLSEKREGAQA